ncbi:MAG: amylo-alpha-1,6-glucosidase [bacterium]
MKKKWSDSTANFCVNNEDFNEMIQRGHKDINMLRINSYYGEYIAAGIPWFTTLFGRDSIISARQSLLLTPDIAKNVLLTLAKFQGKEKNEWKDEEPGKIPHEIRFGELARSNKVPHSAYYGSVDATLLWIILLYDYLKWTNDIETLEKLWQNALDCFEWANNSIYNGYIVYKTKSAQGLRNQGWKDSHNSIVYSNGDLAEPPIALVEVQGYMYAAKIRLAELAGYMGENNLKIKLLGEAQELKDRFHKDFWMEDLQFYAMGLDKDNKPLKVISSNPGHCLETGILDDYYANIIAERFFAPDMFSGWGTRTLSAKTLVYNPMSYHNGSIWPHDNSIIAYGLSKINRTDLALKIFIGLFEAARLMRYKRLPELFCGFSRKYEKLDPPVRYPVACSPQAWSAASIFLLLQSILNITPNAQNAELKVSDSMFPYWLDYIKINNIQVGNATINIEFRKATKGLVIDVLDKRGKLNLIITK